MRLTPILLMVILSASQVQAEAVRVRSGEHEDFSRIVMVFRNAINWKESRTSDGFVVSFDRNDISVDLSRVFQLIPRDRIENVTFDEGTASLTIESSCNCDLEIFSAGKNTLAIDVKSSTEPHQTKDLPPKDTPRIVSSILPFGYGRSSSSWADAAVESGHSTRSLALQATEQPSSEQELASAKEMEEDLLRQLGRAATQGLAKISTTLPDHSESTDRSAMTATPGAVLDGVSHIATETAFDRVGLSINHGATRHNAGTRCFGAEVLDVAAWLPDADPATSIALGRIGVSVDRPETDPASVAALAKTYVALGFGAEAIATLGAFRGDVPHADLLTAMADIVDTGVARDPSILSAGLDCAGPTAMWAFLSKQQHTESPNLQSIQEWYLKLPLGLRNHLGSVLTERLQLNHQDEVALMIRDAALRSMSKPTSHMALVEATSALAGHKTELAAKQLSQIVSDANDLSPEALVHLLETNRILDQEDTDLAILAEAMALENRGTTVGFALLEQAVLTWADAGDMDTARSTFARLQGERQTEPVPDPVLSRLVEQMIETNDEVGIMSMLHSSHFQLGDRQLERLAVLSLADWLIGNGLPAEAGQLLVPFELEDQVDVRQIRAKVAMAMEYPALALAVLAGEEDPLSIEIRAQAYAAQGDHKMSANLFDDIKQVEKAGQQAWLSRDADKIRALRPDIEPDVVNFLERARQDTPMDQTAPGSAPPETGIQAPHVDIGLSRIKELVVDSERDRRAIQAALDMGS